MELLQRLQYWYTINCNGDWEHSYGISITNVDNAGWYVTIDLQETCLEKAVLPLQPTIQRSPTDWVVWRIENQQFVASGGPGNLSEILSYFLDILLPQQGDRCFEYEVCILLREYNGSIWRLANALLISESQLQIHSFIDLESPGSYVLHNEASFEDFKQLEATSLKDAIAVAEQGDIITVTVQEHIFSTNLVYTGTVEQ